MKKLFTVLFIFASLTIISLPAVAKDYLWICPVVTTDSVPNEMGVAPVIWAGDYLFEITVDDGIISTEFMTDIQKKGGKLFANAKFYGDKSRALIYRKIVIVGNRMAVQRADGTIARGIILSESGDHFHQALYPLEPTNADDWAGQLKK